MVERHQTVENREGSPAKADARDDSALLKEMVRRLVTVLHPRQIYLFGSRARGDAGADSDYDLLVVVATSDLPPHRRDVLAFRALHGLGVSKDVLVYTVEEFTSRREVTASLPATVVREGKLLYAA